MDKSKTSVRGLAATLFAAAVLALALALAAAPPPAYAAGGDGNGFVAGSLQVQDGEADAPKLSGLQLYADGIKVVTAPTEYYDNALARDIELISVFDANSYDYKAFVSRGSELAVAATSADGVTIKVNGSELEGDSAPIEPVWRDDNTALVEIKCVSESGTSTYTLTLHEAPALAITKAPNKTVYEPGELIDTEGMEVTATYDGEEPVELSSDKYKVTHTGPVSIGMTEFTIASNGQYASQPITVNNAEVSENLRIFSDAKFTSGPPSNTPIEMSPEFDPAVKYHTIKMNSDSSQARIYLTLANPDAQFEIPTGSLFATPINVTYTNNANGTEVSSAVYFYQGKIISPTVDETGTFSFDLSGKVGINSLENNSFKVKVTEGQGQEVAYVFTTQRVVVPSTLSVKLASTGEQVDFQNGPYSSSQHDYDLYVNAGEKLIITSAASVNNAIIRLNGELLTGDAIDPVWDENLNYDMVLTFDKPGGATGVYTIHAHQQPTSLELVKAPNKTSYAVGDAFESEGALFKAHFSGGRSVDLSADKVDWSLSAISFGCDSVTATFHGASVDVPLKVGMSMEGTGIEEDPYQIATAEDYDRVRKLVADGYNFEGEFLQQTADITLPDGWTPIGVTKDGTNSIKEGANLNAFSGTLDGGGFTVTVPADCPPLIGYVKGAAIKNLNVCGKHIVGHGLVNNLEGVGLEGQAVTLDNITVLSGTNITKSGLIGGNITTNGFSAVSWKFLTTITNCTVEEGVVVGCDGDESKVGGIAGRLQGTIENCTCNATVKGVNFVGGILASRDNAMGACSVTDCTFGGSVEASGKQAGGIAGGCYDNETAPNGGRVTIENCTVTGSVTGEDMVGGIQGGDRFVDQPWANVTSSMTGNAFLGTVVATAENPQAVGAIIGFMNGMNKFDGISGNYYRADCGADRAWGQIRHVDTSKRAYGLDEATGVFYYNTGAEFPYEKPDGTLFNSWEEMKQDIHLYVDGERDPYVSVIQTGLNRDDDPLGDDEELLFFSDNQLADYAAVEAALAEVPEGFEDAPYTDASIKALKDAIAAAGQYKPAWEQDAVNAIAQAITDAIAGLEVDVDKAVAAAEAAANDAQDKADAAQAAADAATAAADKAAKSGTAEDAAAAAKAAADAKQAAADAQVAADAAKDAAEVAKTAAEAAGDQGALGRATAAADKAEAAAGKASAAAKAAQSAAEAAAAAQAAAAAPKDNPMKVTAKSVKVKAKKLKKKAQTVDAVAVTGAQGEVTYKIAKIKTKKKLAKQAKKKIKMAANGKLKLKKKLKKGTYKVTVKVRAAGNASYKAAEQTVVVKVKVK